MIWRPFFEINGPLKKRNKCFNFLCPAFNFRCCVRGLSYSPKRSVSVSVFECRRREVFIRQTRYSYVVARTGAQNPLCTTIGLEKKLQIAVF